MKIPDVTPARRGRVNLHGSILDEERNEEGKREGASERERESGEGRGEEIIAGSGKTRERERRVKYLNRRGNETPGTNNKQANKNRHPPSPRRLSARGALGASRFSNSPACPDLAATWDAVAKSKKNARMSITRYVP